VIRRKYFVIFKIFVFFLCFVFLINELDNSKALVKANSLEFVDIKEFSSVPVGSNDLITDEAVNSDVIIYFLIDKSKSVEDYCLFKNNHRDAEDAITMINTLINALGNYGNIATQKNNNISIGVSKFSDDVVHMLEITEISDLTRTQIEDFVDDSKEIFSKLEKDDTFFNMAIEDASSLMDNYDSNPATKKILVLMTDGEMSTASFSELNVSSELEFFREINKMNSGNEMELFYGLYPGSKQIEYYEEATLSLDEHLLSTNVFDWPNQIFSNIYPDENSFGWVTEGNSKSVTIDGCMVNQFFSYPNDQDQEVNLLISTPTNRADEVIKTSNYIPVMNSELNKNYQIYTKSTIGFYWIESYQPELKAILEPEKIFVSYKGRNEGIINVSLVSIEDSFYKKNAENYKKCYMFDTDYIWKEDNLYRKNDFSYPIRIMLPEGICNQESYESNLTISSTNGEQEITEKYFVDLIYESQIIGYPEMDSPNITDENVKTVYKINFNVFMNSEPQIYLIRPKRIEDDIPTPPCLRPTSIINNYEYLLISKDNWISETIPKESNKNRAAAATYVVNDEHYTDCVSTIEFSVYEDSISSNFENSYPSLLFAWNDEIDSKSKDTAIICDIDPVLYQGVKTVLNCHIDNSLLPKEEK
jgi:hypothetical protein